MVGEYESFVREIRVAGGVGLVEDDVPLALPMHVESNFGEVVLVGLLQVFVGVVVFIVAVVESL